MLQPSGRAGASREVSSSKPPSWTEKPGLGSSHLIPSWEPPHLGLTTDISSFPLTCRHRLEEGQATSWSRRLKVFLCCTRTKDSQSVSPQGSPPLACPLGGNVGGRQRLEEGPWSLYHGSP